MSSLEASRIHQRLSERTGAKLDLLESFASVDSTNTYLMSEPAPEPGRFRVAIAGEQTKGRGRHNREWVSKPGAGLYLSFAYTFSSLPAHLPGLTLALGVGIIDSLVLLGIHGVSLKWPNDIVAQDGKLGGILTEVQSNSAVGAAVIAGIGLNIDLPDDIDVDAGWAHRPVDMNSVMDNPPAIDELAAGIIESMFQTYVGFEQEGFGSFVDDWRKHDWLLGRSVTVDTPERQISGTAAGVDHDGALLVERNGSQTRILSGSIVLAGAPL
jgi:BirA family biotin operon repressor/biotin-[acetyl-CoA-carboxylase] ligase